MIFGQYLWLLLCYAKYARSSLVEEYEDISNNILYPRKEINVDLPVELGKDITSGCICRSSLNRMIVVCFGNYECRRFPKITVQSRILRVRTTVITEIRRGDLDKLGYLEVLEIDANSKLTHLEPGIFRNLTKLQHLSISYNALYTLHERIFEGLTNLHNLTLINNKFTNIERLTPAFSPRILPALRGLDLSENNFEKITSNAFTPMKGTLLTTLNINLCRVDYIHADSFLPLKMLKDLNIGENNLDSILIGNLLLKMKNEGINLIRLNLSAMGFRKRPPIDLMTIISQTTVKILSLALNQFELISDDCFPVMPNIEVLDLRKVFAILVGHYAFDTERFPSLKVLLLSGNNLPGLHYGPVSNKLIALDLSNNKGSDANPLYYEIDRDIFNKSSTLKILNLSYNRIKSIFDYTFKGLDRLKYLNLENGTLYHIGAGTFKSTYHLEILNLANNPLTTNQNISSAQFEGLNELRVLNLGNCGIKHLYDEDNIFEMMPNLTHLILKNNQLVYITAETLKPMKYLKILDLSQNLLVSWWRPLFLASGVTPQKFYITNNKISHFSLSMVQDINFLLEKNPLTEINLMDNVFVCDCSAMYQAYLWLVVNGTAAFKQYFARSDFLCSSPDVWENRRVADYLSSIKRMQCLVYEKITSVMLLVWTAPSIITIAAVTCIIVLIYKYRMYVRYWIFLAKIALGKKLIRNRLKGENEPQKGYKYDAFVSYSNEDREFVLEMISQLEGNSPYLKLCVYERDFEIGSFISEAVLSSINESKYVILIISNNFAKSQWCRWETQLAEYHRLFLEDGTSYDPLVLVRLGDIESKYLTTTLKYLLKTKIYHAWNEQNAEEFWRKLRNVLIKSK